MKLYCTLKPNTDYTCLSHKQLLKIARLYNTTYPDNPINVDTSMKLLYQQLMNRNQQCKGKGDSCLIEQCFIRKNSRIYQELGDSLLPIRPVGKKAWLSTEDIDQFLIRLMKLNPNFLSFRPVPIDFMKPHVGCQYIKSLDQNLCLNRLNLKSLYQRGIRKIGIVFNTDPSTESGQHWIALFIDLNRREINYWDSYGTCPAPSEITAFIETLKNQAQMIYQNNHAKFMVNCNTIRHQYGDSECGVYCLYFIKKSLEDVSFDQIISNIINDEQMNSMREEFFRPNFTVKECKLPLYNKIYGSSQMKKKRSKRNRRS